MLHGEQPISLRKTTDWKHRKNRTEGKGELLHPIQIPNIQMSKKFELFLTLFPFRPPQYITNWKKRERQRKQAEENVERWNGMVGEAREQFYTHGEAMILEPWILKGQTANWRSSNLSAAALALR